MSIRNKYEREADPSEDKIIQSIKELKKMKVFFEDIMDDVYSNYKEYFIHSHMHPYCGLKKEILENLDSDLKWFRIKLAEIRGE